MRLEQPFHEGELEAQRRAGETLAAARNGKAIGDEIMPGASKFVAQQRLAAVATIDPGGDVWASLLFGEPGFLSPPDRRHVDVDLAKVAADAGDPLWSNLRGDPRVGMLLIEFETRRRLRINGRGAWARPNLLRLTVEEAYPNCPQYIRRRHPRTAAPGTEAPPVAGGRIGIALRPDHVRWIAAADTLFVASAHPARGADVSHRGGAPGFVSIVDDRTLRIPDYSGNGMFNTLGNLTLDPRAGIVLPEFETGRTLQLVGQAVIRWESGCDTSGGGRCWDFHVKQWREAAVPLAPRWQSEVDHSPRPR